MHVTPAAASNKLHFDSVLPYSLVTRHWHAGPPNCDADPQKPLSKVPWIFVEVPLHLTLSPPRRIWNEAKRPTRPTSQDHTRCLSALYPYRLLPVPGAQCQWATESSRLHAQPCRLQQQPCWLTWLRDWTRTVLLGVLESSRQDPAQNGVAPQAAIVAPSELKRRHTTTPPRAPRGLSSSGTKDGRPESPPWPPLQPPASNHLPPRPTPTGETARSVLARSVCLKEDAGSGRMLLEASTT